MTASRAISPSKVNLFLRVGPLREDGFHPLVTWMCTTGLADEISILPATGSDRVTCTDPGIPLDDSNLALRACRAVRGARPGLTFPPVHIHIEKQIPAGAGLGGGSSNAATVLKLLDAAWNLRLSPQELLAMAGGLGSDVPFFLFQPSALCRGRGEIVQMHPKPLVRGIVLILPGLHVSTPAVYHEFDRRCTPADLSGVLQQEWELRDPGELARLQNDLEPAAFAICPELAHLQALAEKCANRPVRMTGSGSALFALAASPREASELAQELAGSLGIRCIGVELCPEEPPRVG